MQRVRQRLRDVPGDQERARGVESHGGRADPLRDDLHHARLACVLAIRRVGGVQHAARGLRGLLPEHDERAIARHGEAHPGDLPGRGRGTHLEHLATRPPTRVEAPPPDRECVVPGDHEVGAGVQAHGRRFDPTRHVDRRAHGDEAAVGPDARRRSERAGQQRGQRHPHHAAHGESPSGGPPHDRARARPARRHGMRARASLRDGGAGRRSPGGRQRDHG